ncbi:MAG TPA: glycoside hydrolase family 3 N-terminal domain-containing protein, partial [Ktedonobacteraceae bacterium]|nr:glycoside hydrolase family 3 N-terminal domain-containing protein [Ktedonobacteraceae bacterium]
MFAYKNHLLATEERVEDLLGRMTLREKVGQLNQRMYGWHAYRKQGTHFELTEAFRQEVAFGDGMGALYGLLRADPWSGMTFANGITSTESAGVANQIQRYVLEHTRLGIPVLLSEECPHGHQALDGTLFPTNLGIGSTWNPALYERACAWMARELRARGTHLGLISALDVLRDPRWGRAEECYGEDPFLAAQMAGAATRGLQGQTPEELASAERVAAVLKAFCAQGAGEGGRNMGPALIGERELREIHLPPMEAGTRAGALACMAAYNEIDGVPCAGNAWLLTGLLRDQWGFQGMVMSDAHAIDRLQEMLTDDYASAAALALTAGIDMSMWDVAFTHLEAAVRQGKVAEALVDRAVRRVLTLKFRLGLFEHPYTDETLAARVVGSPQARALNLEVARESIVLLKNQGELLPLPGDLRSIAVIGPNADAPYNQLGDYTANQREGAVTTVLQGVRAHVSAQTTVLYARGCGIRDQIRDGFAEAIDAARQAEVALLVLGGCSTRDFSMQFAETGAVTVTDHPSEMNCGEGMDLANLELEGVQEELVRAIVATGTPVVVTLIQGRPHAVPHIAELCQALLCAWYPGQEGGQAIAEVLFGSVNPSGKLSVSLPRSAGQLPVYYNKRKTSQTPAPYVDEPASPLYTFGYGLSYTTFAWTKLTLQPEEIRLADLEKGQQVQVTLSLTNTGRRAGAEVLQLYIHDRQASVSRRVLELKGWRKVYLEAGEQTEVTFSLGKEELSIWDK